MRIGSRVGSKGIYVDCYKCKYKWIAKAPTFSCPKCKRFLLIVSSIWAGASRRRRSYGFARRRR